MCRIPHSTQRTDSELPWQTFTMYSSHAAKPSSSHGIKVLFLWSWWRNLYECKLVVWKLSTGPLLFLLLPGEVGELTCTEDILITAHSMKQLYLTIHLLKSFQFGVKKTSATTKINDSTEIITPFKSHYRPRVSDFQHPTHKDARFSQKYKDK